MMSTGESWIKTGSSGSSPRTEIAILLTHYTETVDMPGEEAHKETIPEQRRRRQRRERHCFIG